jgi:hypothetical protein
MIELSTRTKASYTYVKDWMMLRECVAGCLGSLQTTSHQNVRLKLRLPEGSPAKFVKISGALQITKRATGRDAEAALGDLRFGDKRGMQSITSKGYFTLLIVTRYLSAACHRSGFRLAGPASAGSLGDHRLWTGSLGRPARPR